MLDPIGIFKNWYNDEKKISKALIPSACCLSTIGIDGFPNARYVSLKDICSGKFIITGSIITQKGLEIFQNNKVALTFWWNETKRQVRIQGFADKISNDAADIYFAERDISSKLATVIIEQAKKNNSSHGIEKKLEKMLAKEANEIPRPASWGGYSISPVRIEFMKFQTNRLHSRKLFEIVNHEWNSIDLFP